MTELSFEVFADSRCYTNVGVAYAWYTQIHLSNWSLLWLDLFQWVHVLKKSVFLLWLTCFQCTVLDPMGLEYENSTLVSCICTRYKLECWAYNSPSYWEIEYLMNFFRKSFLKVVNLECVKHIAFLLLYVALNLNTNLLFGQHIPASSWRTNII